MSPRTPSRAQGTPRGALSAAALLSAVLAVAATTLLSVPATADTALGDPTEAALELGLAQSAQATTTNVVPNPGFEQGGCGNTLDLCGWKAVDGVISQDTTYPHSGSASTALYGLSGSASATTDPAFCTAIGPGTHTASFWYRTPEQGNPDYDVAFLYFGADFYTGPNCTGSASSDGLSETPIRDNAWHKAIGYLVAPPGTVSGSFGVDIAAGCNICFYVVANFDDLDVEDEVSPDTTPPETTITSGPSGTTNSTSAAFGFTANEPSTFECSLDSGAFTACASPASYTGLGDGSHTFRVRATDASGNADPTPAEQTWTVHTNTPPIARFTYICSALSCRFDGGGSTDSDGTIQTYSWDFGDGTAGHGKTAQHTYAQAQSYTVKLTATDDADASDTAAKAITLIHLTAHGYEVKGLQRVDLSWSWPSGASFDVYRDGVEIAAELQTMSHTDSLNKRGSGSYTYRVCADAAATCSNEAQVTF